MGYSPSALRQLLSILVLVLVGYLAAASVSASAGWRVNVNEVCSSKLLPGAGVMLTTKLTFRNAKGGRSTSVRVIAGWNIGRLYPKAETALVVRLGPGRDRPKGRHPHDPKRAEIVAGPESRRYQLRLDVHVRRAVGTSRPYTR